MSSVSVVIPAYNAEQYLRVALSSVISQTHRDLEVIVVDDGSTDRTGAVCRELVDPRIRVVHQPNRGLAAARNTGIRQARGTYVAFLDADDLWHPDKLAHHARHLAAAPEVGLSYSRAGYIDAAGAPLGMYQAPPLGTITAARLLVDNPIRNGSNAVLRRAALDEIRLQQEDSTSWYFDETLRRAEDLECWLRIAATTRWRIEGIPDVLVQYRTTRGSLSANTAEQYRSWCQAMTRVRGYAPELVRQHRRASKAYYLRYLAQRAILANRDGPEARRLLRRSLAADWRMPVREPFNTAMTWAAAEALGRLPDPLYRDLEKLAMRATGALQVRNWVGAHPGTHDPKRRGA